MRVGERRINYGAPGEGGSATEGGTEAWHRGREGPRQAVCAVGMKSEERGMHGRMEDRLLGARGHWSGMVIDRTITMGSFSFLKRSRRFD